MATEADIPVPECETRGEQVAHFVDNIIKVSVSKLPLEKQTQDDKYDELPAVEGGNFLRPPSTDEAHSEINNASPDASKVTEKPDQQVELAAEEGLSTEEIQQNVEESNSTEIVTSDPGVDDARVVTQLSKDTGIDLNGTNASYTENVALIKEIVQETSLPSEETESHAPCISEVEEPNVQVKATDNKSADEKPTEEDLSCNLTNEVSGEGESDQCTLTSEKKVIANERSAEDNLNAAAEEGSQENSEETITTLEASNTDELQSKSDINTSFSKEEEYGVPLESTLSERQGDVECQSKTLEDAATDHSDPKLTKKYEESLLIQVEDSQIEHNEHSEVESARCPLTAASAEETNDNVLATTDNVKGEDEDHKGAELSENEPSITCTSVKEDRQIEIPELSLLVAPENIEVSNLSQEKSIEGSPEEQSTNETLHGNTTEAEEATIDAVDQPKKNPESFPPIVSSSPEEESMNAVLQEVTSGHTDENIEDVDKHKEDLENLSIGEDHSEINYASPDVSTDTEKPDQTERDCHDTLLSSPKLDDQPVEFSANEETSVEQVQQNAEESCSTEKDGDKGVVSEHSSTDSSVVTSEMKVGDTLDDPEMDDARVVTQLSNDTGSDHHGTNDSFTENIALTQEILQETNIPCKEIESHTPCISEGGELNVHVKTTDNNSGDEKKTEDNVSCNLTSEVSKEGESDRNEMTSDQEVLANERIVEDSFNIAAEDVSQENNASTETITSLETSNSEESKSDLNLSFSKKEETAVQKGDKSVTVSGETNDNVPTANEKSKDEDKDLKEADLLEDAATEHSDPTHAEKPGESSLIQVDDSRIERDGQFEEGGERLPLTEALTGETNDNVPTANEKSKDEDEDLKEADLLEDAAAEHSDPTHAETPEESSLIQVDNSQIERDEQLEEEGERLPLTEALTGETNDNVPTANEKSKDEDKDLKEADLSESEQSTRCTSVKEDVQIENPGESLHEAPENTEVSNLCQENNIKGPLEEESTNANLLGNTIETDEATIGVVDRQKESLENPSTSLSTEDAEGNLSIELDSSENKNLEDLVKENEMTSLPLPLEREVSDESKFLHEARFEDGEPKETEFCDNEISTESRNENTDVTSEDTTALDLGQETEKISAMEEQNLSTHPLAILDKRSDCGTVEAAEENEVTLENLPTIVPNEKTDENSSVQDDGEKMETDEHSEREIEQLSSIKDHTGNVNNDEVIEKDDVKFEDENPSGADVFEKDKDTENVSLPEEVQSEKPVESLHAAPEDVKTSDFDQDTEATGMYEEQIPIKNSQGMSTDETDGEAIDAANTIEKTQELQNGSNEESNKELLIEVDASEMKHDTNLEEELERPSLTEASKEDLNDKKSTILPEPETGDECISKVELPNDEKSTDNTTPKKDTLQDAPEDHKTSTSSSDIETTGSLEGQSLAENSQAKKIIDAANENELALENVATEIPQGHIEDNSAAQVHCLEGEQMERLEKENQNSLTEAPIEETNAREPTNIEDHKNQDEDSIKPELENEEKTESIFVEEEADVEKPVESLQVKAEDSKQHDSSLDIDNSFVEQIPTIDPRDISVDNTEGESVVADYSNEESLELKDIAKTIPDCDNEYNIPKEEVGLLKPTIEDSEGSPNDEQSTKNTEGGLIKEEETIKSLQVAAQDIDTPPLGRGRETSSLDEQSPVITPEGIMHDNKEDIDNNAIGLDDEPPKDKQNIANTTLYEDKEENMQIQEDCSPLEQNVDLGNDSENTPGKEAPIVYTTESSPVKEEENTEKCIEEQILTADPQETCDKTKEKPVDAANEKNVILEDVALSALKEGSEDNSPIEVYGSQKPSSQEVLVEKINDDEPTTIHEADFANENAVKEHLFEDAKKIECDLVKEEVYIESLQVADEDIKDTSSSQDREASPLEEQPPTTDSHITTGDYKDEKTLKLNDPEEETLEEKNYATTLHEDTKEDSLNQVDSSLLEKKEHSEKDSESTSFADSPKDDTTEKTLIMDVAQVEDPIDFTQVATENITAFAPCLDTGKSSTVELILDPEDISSNKITEKIIDATGEETQEAQDNTKSVPREDDSSDEKIVEATLIGEDVSVESPQVAPEDMKQSCLSEVTETTFQEEQILTANPRGLVDNGENKTIDSIVIQKETPKDEVPKEIESADFKSTPIELKVEEGYLKDHQENSSNLTDEKTPNTEDLDVNEDIIGHISEISNHKQQESSTKEVSEHMTTSNKHVSDSTSLESEVSEKNIDQVIGEAKNFGDKTDSEEIGSIVVPTSETLAEKDPRGCTEAEVQVPNEEKEAELIKQEAEIDQNIKETLLNNASEGVSESEEVNVEEKIDSINCEEISASSSSVASEEVSTSNVVLKEGSTFNSSQGREEAETEEAQKQESKLQVSEPIPDSSVEKIERDAQSANDPGIIEEVQKLKGVPLPVLEENIIKTTDCKDSDIVEDATSNEYIDHLEQEDTKKCFSDGKNLTEEEQVETVANDVLPVSPTETPEVDYSTTERELICSEEPCIDEKIKFQKGNNDEKEACEEKISDISSAAPDMIEARETDVAKLANNSNNTVETAEGTVINENTSAVGITVNKTSVTDFETKNDDEASETKETTPSSAKGQDVGGASVEENSNFTGSLTEEKSDSDEVAIAPEENKSGYESNNRMLESIAQDQSCDIISETGEAEIKSDKAVSEDIFEQETAFEKEIMKDAILSEKEQLPTSNAEDEDIKDYDQGSCAEEVITDSHQEDEVKQKQQENNKETDELIKYGNEIEMVTKVSEEVDDKAPEDLKEKTSTIEVIDSILPQEEQAKSIEATTNIDTEKAQELDNASVQTDTHDSNEEGVKIAIIPSKESDEHNKKDEICSPDDVQAKYETSVLQENVVLSEGKSKEEAKEADTWTKPNEDEDKEAYFEAKKIDFASQTKDISEYEVSDGAQDIPENNENFTTKNKLSEEDYPSKSTEFEVSSASENIALTEQASEATIVTTEVQEAKAGIDLGAGVPKATGLENPVVEEENDICAAVAVTSNSTPVEPSVVDTSKIIPECTVGIPMEADDQQTKVHDLQEYLNIRDSEVKMAEKDYSVNLQSVRDISKESCEVPNNENPVEGGLEEKIETSEGQETKSIQNAPVSETRKHETEEQQLGSDTVDVHEEHKLNSTANQLESPSGTETEKILESGILQSAVENTAQHDKKEGSQQIDAPPFLPQAQYSDIKTSENDLLVHVAGLDSVDVTEPEVSPLPLKDKHVVLEADDTRNLNPENLDGDKSKSTECSLGELEIVKPSKVEQEEATCGNEEGTEQEREGNPESKETDKASQSDFFQVSMRDGSQMADHSATEKEPTSHTQDLHAENSDEAEHENLKTDEEKDDEEESHEQRRSELGSEAPVIVEMGDADLKVAHKKSHNILSGVGSKVKHSIAKVKKAIIGKSSHPKTPSPKKVIN